ncbi:MAG TPA: response regulator, partial [Candidatus Ozemobacteraceae bacterium]|nr:response regulator [Candidatus Ozemobacteraceae bacterium]
ACPTGDGHVHRLLSVNPDRSRSLFEQPWFTSLVDTFHVFSEPGYLDAQLVTEGIWTHLTESGFHISLVIPLFAAQERMGAILLLGLPEQKRMAVLRETLRPLSQIVGLLLKNILLVEEQDLMLDARARGLRESESRLSHAQRSAGFGVWELDTSHDRLILTSSAWDILRVPPSDAPDLKTLLEPVIMAEDFPLLDAALQRTLQLRQPLDVEFRIQQSGERCRWLRLAGGWSNERDGEKSQLFGVFQDVTERRDIEERLRHSEKLEAIGQLAGTIAHDFNNMLSGILGYADLLMQELPAGSHRQITEKIIGAAQRSADVARKLLLISRKEKVKMGTCDLHQILHDVIGLLGHSLDKRITVSEKLQAGGATTFGDQSQLQNVFLNLALNARDAMPDGGMLTISTADVRVTINTPISGPLPVAPGRYIAVSVSDTGCGMSAQVKKHLFQPFFTTKESGKGTGLGLTAVLSTVSQHQGAVTYESEAGTGTTFTVYLPFTSAAEVRVANDVEPRAVVVKGTVLVVDDEEIVRKLTTQMMKKLGYSVETCEDGQAAVEICSDHGQRFQAVILDIAMPRLNGRDAFVAIRQRHPELPVLFCSGYIMDTDLSDLLSQPAVGFLSKPFRQVDLAVAIAELLHRADPHQAISAKVPAGQS